MRAPYLPPAITRPLPAFRDTIRALGRRTLWGAPYVPGYWILSPLTLRRPCQRSAGGSPCGTDRRLLYVYPAWEDQPEQAGDKGEEREAQPHQETDIEDPVSQRPVLGPAELQKRSSHSCTFPQEALRLSCRSLPTILVDVLAAFPGRRGAPGQTSPGLHRQEKRAR